MARTVDQQAHEQRRHALAEAAWRVIQRDGLEHASVRKVATEAGVSMGSLRHYFSTQSELLAFSLGMVGEGMMDRIRQLNLAADPVDRAAQILLTGLLPTGPRQHTVTKVWLAFLGRVLTEPALRQRSDELYDATAELVAWVVDELAASGVLRAGLDLEREAQRLYVFVDGLTVQALIRPEKMSPHRVRELLREHLAQLCR
ncbi:TetR family transcriptional regulator [Nocardia brasiliensis]|uniref:TetR family transcriptional regulator n=1 Tax=Nocardia brasiliensis TaxID=37326 RepID=A0A6G9XMB0_NOCBR|nr:TetR family transcriptional regulator C-terminal domain-containing protein [Nocardia brasiliensis]QIS02044.1 TetR family transcriptional regulator [Nocardia brasiliensis]